MPEAFAAEEPFPAADRASVSEEPTWVPAQKLCLAEVVLEQVMVQAEFLPVLVPAAFSTPTS